MTQPPDHTHRAQNLQSRADNLPRKPNTNLDHLPGDYGTPIVGHTWGLLTNGDKLSQNMTARYGHVYRTSALLQRAVGLAGPDAAQFVLLDKQQLFAAKPAWTAVLGGLFDNGLLLRDFADHRSHRRALQQAFKKPVLDAYCTTLNSFLGDGISAWPEQQFFDFYPAIKNLLLDNAIESFFGTDPNRNIAPLNRAFIDMLNATLTLIRQPLPGTRWRRGIRGRKTLEVYLEGQLHQRKSNPGNDFFSSLCKASTQGENNLSDSEIIDHLMFLLFAAHDTTSSTLSSMMKILCRHPEWQTRLREEFSALQADTLQLSDFESLPQTDWFFREALRMHPPVPAVTRRLTRECHYEGHRLPENTSVFLQIRDIHYMPEYWVEPEKFDPERWSPERAEHKKHSFQWIPFGGGAHKCLGLHFAEMQTKVFLFHLLTHFSVEADPKHRPRVRYVPMEIPGNGLPVRLTRL